MNIHEATKEANWRHGEGTPRARDFIIGFKYKKAFSNFGMGRRYRDQSRKIYRG